VNIQNIPRNDKTIKTAFIPKLDAMLYFDYANIELRILGYYLAVALKDFSLVDEFNEGADIHRITAGRIFNKSPEDVTDTERQAGKTLIFSMCYGGGVPTLQRQGVVQNYLEGKKLVASFHESRPGIKKLSDKLIESYESKGYIRLINGARKHPESDHKALNVLVQGTGAVIMREAFVRVYQYLSRGQFKSHLINSVHDEIQLDVARSELYTLTDTIPPLMTHPKIEDILHLDTSLEVTYTNWADKHEWTGEVEYG
jgi:DNA polymerase-1